MTKNKILGFILAIVGLILSILSLIFIPLPAIGFYLLLGAYQPKMGNLARILISFVSAFLTVMAMAFFLIY